MKCIVKNLIHIRLVFIFIGAIILLPGCGGGGTSEGSLPPIPPGAVEPPLQVRGAVTVLDAKGERRKAPQGQLVELVTFTERGAPDTVIGSTSTDGEGGYLIEAPNGLKAGLRLGVLSSDGVGGKWRGIVLNNDASIGPASEAVTQEIFSIRNGNSAFAEADSRLAIFYRNSTMVLDSLKWTGLSSADIVKNLRTELVNDSAAKKALNALKSDGKITSSIGDIGGVFGLTALAVEYSDGTDTPAIRRNRRSLVQEEIWLLEEIQPSDKTIKFQAQVKPEADGIVQSAILNSSPILAILGEHRTASFNWSPGVEQVLISGTKDTYPYDFDADGKVDSMTFKSTQTFEKVDNLSLMGDDWRTLLFVFRTDLTINLSGGGNIKLTGLERKWQAPKVGAIKVEQIANTIDKDGKEAQTTLNMNAVRAVGGNTSWPGRVQFSEVAVGLPWESSQSGLLGIDASDKLVVKSYVSTRTGISTHSLQNPVDSVNLLISSPYLAPIYKLSKDGRFLYVAISQSTEGTSEDKNDALPISVANSLGAEIVRYDTHTLQETMRFRLPALPSSLKPGYGYPRYLARDIIVSPTENDTYIVSGIDTVLVKNSTVTSTIDGISTTPEEVLLPNGSVFHISEKNSIRAWDASRNELRFDFQGGGTRSRSIPIIGSAFDVQGVRQTALDIFFFNIFPPFQTTYDYIGSERIYVNGFKTVYDSETGKLIRNIINDPEQDLGNAQCILAEGEIVCIDYQDIFFLDLDLNTKRRLSTQPDLRELAGVYRVQANQPGLIRSQAGYFYYMSFTSNSSSAVVVKATWQ